MTNAATLLAEHECRLDQHDDDIRRIYRDINEVKFDLRSLDRWVRREVGWLQRAMSGLMHHLGAEPPPRDEEEE